MNGTEINFDFKNAKKAFSRMGLGLIAFFVATTIAQLILVALFPNLFSSNYSAQMILSSATMYLVGFPAFYLVVRPIKKYDSPKQTYHPAYIAAAFLIAMFFMQAGQIVGNTVYLTIYEKFGIDLASTSLEIVNNITWYEALIFAVIIGPLFEELMFRKLILDRVSVYGEKLAMIFSALMFAFFHMSVQQFFYAFLIGLLLSYIYIRSKNIITCYIIHAIINFFGSVVPLALFEFIDIDAFFEAMSAEDPEVLIKFINENFIAYAIVSSYSLVTIGLAIAGIVVFFKMRRKVYFDTSPLELPKDSEASVAFTNIGTVLFILFSVAYPFVDIYLSKL